MGPGGPTCLRVPGKIHNPAVGFRGSIRLIKPIVLKEGGVREQLGFP